jgi:hypothetical protein
MTPFPDNYESYLASLPIPREADNIEELTDEAIGQITRIVFMKPDPHPADFLFVFGTSAIDNQVLKQITDYFNNGFFPWVLVTGMIGKAYYQTGKPLAHIMRDEFIANGIPSDKILIQDRSTNTLEDVQFSLDILDKHKIVPRHIAFLSKAHHSGRCFLTLRKFFPNQPLWPITYEAKYNGIYVSAKDWPEHPIAQGRVYGEYLRIIKYSQLGDIAPIEIT